jgi:soluble lytic murein transglycosylase
MRAVVLSRKALRWSLVGVLVVYVALVGLRALYPLRYVDEVREWATTRGLDPALVAAVIRAESRFHPDAVSSRGALGLMQIMPETGRWIAAQIGLSEVEPLCDPELNLRLGTWYLRNLIDRFDDVESALMAYNAGPATVERWREQHSDPFPETRAYVHRVLASVPVYRVYFRVPLLLRISPSIAFWFVEATEPVG